MTFAVFLDRDGTIIADKHFLADPDGVELLPGAAEGLRRMRALGARLVVVTNQSGVGRGYFGEDAVERVNARMLELLEAEGVALDGLYVCPHEPEAGCGCRKPAPGLFRRAAEELGLDLGSAFVVGDRDVDVASGHAIGATAILVGSPGGCADLVEAAAAVEEAQASRSNVRTQASSPAT